MLDNKIDNLNYSVISKLQLIEELKKKIEESEAIIVGAGAGLSTAAGFIYNGENFQKYFHDFYQKYGFTDMYSGGFYPFPTLEEFWGNWSRQIYVNRYLDAPKDTYKKLYELLKNKDYFIITTNVDHQFQKSGFDKKRIFYTQGDYGLLQCSEPCHQKAYDNEEIIYNMVSSQGIKLDKHGNFDIRKSNKIKTSIETNLIPYCPVCGKPMTTNLRCDETFVQDEGWYLAYGRYEKFINNKKKSRVLFLELGTGMNTPGIIKYPFWKITNQLSRAFYACLNLNEAYAPENIIDKSLCISEDIDFVVTKLIELTKLQQ